MASSFQYLLLLFLFTAPHSSLAQTSFRPKALIVPVTKDASTNQYIAQIHQRTPLVPVNLVLDVGGQFLWVDCDNNYVSSTYGPTPCNSTICSLADDAAGCGHCNSPPRPGCNNNTCGVLPDNAITHTATGGELAQDIVSVQSTNGFNPGQNVTVSRFIFSCAPTFLLKGLAKGVSGMAGLGRTNISLPSQLIPSFSFHRKFAICLPGGFNTGVAFFGDGPYHFLSNLEATQMLMFTPLILNPVSTASAFSQGQPSSEYFIGVKAIKVDQKVVPNINTTLLSINKEGFGGTKISTVDPYTVLEDSIYKAFTNAYINAWNLKRVSSVAPFEVCFSSKDVGSTRLGVAVPIIELVLQNNQSWFIFGRNSMVQVKEDVMCLGVMNGGVNPRTSIVIGAYQIEDNLLQFDLASSTLGFTSLLYWWMTTCGNFNFTSAP